MYEPPGPTVGHLQLFQKIDKCPTNAPPPLRILLLAPQGGEEDADVCLELWLTHKA